MDEEFTEVLVEAVALPLGSTLGFGFGLTLDGQTLIAFMGDERMIRTIGDALASDAPVVAMVPAWAIRLRIEKPEA